jgi:DNA polymerase
MRGPFTVADWSAIEARLTPWLSTEGDEVLDVFRAGGDIYVNEAQKMFNVREVTPEQRQIGKVAILACGFGGGHNAFAAMGRAYNIKMPEAEARRTVEAWRRANGWAVRYWSNLEWAYNAAMRNPGEHIKTARVTYCFNGQHLWYALPSGRILCYPFARIEEDGITYAKAAWKPAQDAKEWPRARLWKGLACENITQAVANDLLRYALRQVPNVVLHVHDEIVVEGACPDLERIMCTPPAWAADLPLKAEVKTMERYGK